MELILGFTTALMLSVALTPVLIRYAFHLRLVDYPVSERHVHKSAIPRVGGVSIVVGTFIGAAYWSAHDFQLLTLFAGGAVIAVFGLLDDYAELNYRWKFFGQILAVILTMAGGVVIVVVPGFGMDPAPLWISYPLTFLFLLGVINAVNLADGLDGLAGGTVLLSLGLILVFSLQAELFALSLFSLSVMGALLGFLRYNTHPAQVFMGDTGSQFLGYVVATLAIMVTQSPYTALSPVLPLFIVGLPILDTLLVMCIRKARGRSLFVADASHIHHQLLAIGFRHYEVVALLYLIQALFIVLAWRYRYAGDLTALAVYAAFCMAFVGVIGFVRVKDLRFHPREERYQGRERRNNMFRRCEWLHRHGAKLVEVLLSVLLCVAAVLHSEVALAQSTIVLVALVLLLSPLLFKLPYAWFTRLLAYTASIVVASSLMFQPAAAIPWFDQAFDGYLLVLALVLVVSIRVTRRFQFRLDTQDLLVLFLVLVLPLLPFDNIARYQLGHIAIRLAVLFYACEFVVSVGRGHQGMLRVACVASLVVTGLSIAQLG